MGRHSLADNSFHSGKADAILVLEKFTDAADPSVSQMVDIVVVADAVFQMHIVVDGSENIFLCNMLGDQLMNTLFQSIRQRLGILIVLILKKDLPQCGIINELCDAEFFGIAVHIMCDVDHQVAENLDIALLCADPDIRDRGVLDLVRHLP